MTEVFFFICVHMASLEEPPGTFYLGGCILCHIFHNDRQMWTEIVWKTTVKKTCKPKWQFCKYTFDFHVDSACIVIY